MPLIRLNPQLAVPRFDRFFDNFWSDFELEGPQGQNLPPDWGQRVSWRSHGAGLGRSRRKGGGNQPGVRPRQGRGRETA